MAIKYNENYFKGKNFFMGYDSLVMRINCFFRARFVLGMVAKFKKSGKLLDVGCAYGSITNYLHEAGFSVIGLDMSSYAIKIARSKFQDLTFLIWNIENQTKFNDGEFDVVVALDILEHCKDLEKVLCEIKRILKKDGVLVVSFPVTDYSLSNVDSDETHEWYLSLREWLNLFKKVQFKTIEIKNFVYPFSISTFVLLKNEES